MLRDKHHRTHNYLRISLTNHCNLRCFYCIPVEDNNYTPSPHLMQSDEIVAIAGTFIKMGVNKIRLTGGEPLVRKDISDIITRLSKYPIELALTTNGVLLDNFFTLLKKSKVHSLNISLDTLQNQKFKDITKRDLFDKVYANILKAIKLGFKVKINCVVTKEVNNNEILDFVALTKNLPIHIRFIEFMPFAGNRWMKEKVISLQEILNIVNSKYDVISIIREQHDTAKKYKAKGHKGTFAVISTMSSPFCSDCNRLRLTADGKIKNCLFSKEENDVLSSFRRGENIEKIVLQNVGNKAKERGGQITDDFETQNASTLKNRSMISIGG